ncbi:hypothetical protein [Maribrevibacterium harenarium]|uniref:hypothetical protein n=1 Tax=Maribrevibacterium harenarium TaxID=2589817 RepID=UPI001C61595C|nr:hypothetical protein [Maribrevibacterium harenarium]
MNELHVLATLALVHMIALMSPWPDFTLVVQNVFRYGHTPYWRLHRHWLAGS